MNKKKIVLVTLITTVVLAIIGSLWYYLTKEDDKTALTLIEKQWIEKNKNQIYDFGIPTNIPMFTSGGSGIIFDFIKDLENKGKISHKRAIEKAINEYEKYRIIQDKNYVSDFDKLLIETKEIENK